MMSRVVMFLLAAAVVAMAACDEAPNNTELCRRVYNALCDRAESCNSDDFDLADCRAHYWESCRSRVLHSGIEEPTEEQEAACVEAIGLMDCSDLDPRILVECSFLVDIPDADGDGDGDADGDADADADGGGDADADADGDSGSDSK